MFKEKIIKIYKKNVFNRCDNNGCLYYFSDKDFINLKTEEYVFKSSKDYYLKGKIYYYENYIPNRLIIFEHGMGGGHLSYFKEIELLASHGYKVLAYDHSGCFESQGENIGGFSQSLADLNDCINSLKNNPIYKDYKYSVIGHSWGGYSTLNIANFHKDIKHIIAISGFISVEQILKNTFKGLLLFAYNDIYELEKKSNPNFVECSALKSLEDYNGKVLIIHSSDDKTINYKSHFKVLMKKFSNKNNFQFLLVNKKNHNPNYTYDAVKYCNKFFKIYSKQLKNKKLETNEQKEKFKNSFDWNKMTQQDMNVWNKIFMVLNNE